MIVSHFIWLVVRSTEMRVAKIRAGRTVRTLAGDLVER